MVSLLENIFKNTKKDMKSSNNDNLMKRELIKRTNMLKQLASTVQKIELNEFEIFKIENNKGKAAIDIDKLTLENQYKKIESLKSSNIEEKYKEYIYEINCMLDTLSYIKGKTSQNYINYKLIVSIEIALHSYKKIFTEHMEYLKEISFNITKGYEGEKLVNEHLKKHKNLNIINNITLFDGQSKAQCDSIVVSEKGIFILEIKNYASEGTYSIKIDNTGLWTKKIGRQIIKMKSVSEQNERHIALCNSIIKKELKMNVFSKSIIVIANQKATIVNESIETIVRPELIYNVISNSQNSFTEEEVQKICEVLTKFSVKEKKYPILNLENEVNADMKNFINYCKALLKAIEKTYE
ncbi:nuclease-related domain-containing protein [Clostridium thermobutyricum]|uniref:nuclease-related domain-containing protein n=1 Tax=Clostridium thermobutyricum TaxID=29372 RepID=UPI0018A9E3FF|nr:nuclease-related domain-containing protein [Clostridium thermobutyricum]